MRASFKNAPSPVAASVVREKNIREAQAAIKNSQYAGAGAIDLHLSCLDTEFKNVESIKKIMDCTSLPILVLNYNHNIDYTDYTATEEERISLLESGAKAGASAVDMQAYSFNLDVKNSFQQEYATDDMLFAKKNPNEVALDPETVKKQADFIEKMHAMGTEVLLSCHTGVYLNCEECVSLCKYLEKTRKPDIIKLVIPIETDEQLIENFKTMITLKKEITSCKIHFHCSGKKGKITRIVNPMLGAHLAFCIERYSLSASVEQLDLRSFVQAINTLDWRN
jgi:3-dehydroquinate dehydratase